VYAITIRQRGRRTDAHFHSNTALRTQVLRAVKIGKKIIPVYKKVVRV